MKDTNSSPVIGTALAAPGKVMQQTLSEREIECVRLLADGLADKEIGARLDIATRTVRFHILNIKKVLNARTRGHAVAIALRRGMLQRLVEEMAEDADQAKRYRDRASELRAIADGLLDPAAQQGLLQVAQTYDQIADSLDQVENAKRMLRMDDFAA